MTCAIYDRISANNGDRIALIEWSPSAPVEDWSPPFSCTNPHQAHLLPPQYSYSWLQQASRNSAAKLEACLNALQCENAESECRDDSVVVTVGLQTGRDTATVNLVVYVMATMSLNLPFVFVHEKGEFPPHLNCQVIVDCRNDSFVLTGMAQNCESRPDQEKKEKEKGSGSHPSFDSPFPPAVLYYLSTSGSTGEPRWVAGSAAGTWDRIVWQLERDRHSSSCICRSSPSSPLGAAACVMDQKEHHVAKTSLKFVDCIAEMLVPLVAGSTLVVVADGDDSNENMNSNRNPLRDSITLLRVCQYYHITHLVATPTLLQELVVELPFVGENSLALRCIHSSGEALPTSLARRVLDHFGEVQLWNLYGSPEVSADVTGERIDASILAKRNPSSGSSSCASSHQPVGMPLPGCDILLLEETSDGRFQRSAIEGEMFVLGRLVSHGYANKMHGSHGCSNTTDEQSSGFGWLCALNIESNQIQGESQDCQFYRFTSDSTQNRSGSPKLPQWCFRTGDIGRWTTANSCDDITNPKDKCIKARKQGKSLQIVGRRDQLVKLHGVKIPLLQVEAAMKDYCELDGVALVAELRMMAQQYQAGNKENDVQKTLIALAAVPRSTVGSVRAGAAGSSSTCFHCCLPSDCDVKQKSTLWSCVKCESFFRQMLILKLPDTNLLPQRILFTQHIPKNASGKVDRRRARDLSLIHLKTTTRPQNEKIDDISFCTASADQLKSLEKAIQDNPASREAWANWFMRQSTYLLADIVRINQDDDLLQHGFTSMTMIQLVSKTRKLLDRVLSEKSYTTAAHNANLLSAFEQNPTPRQLSDLLVSMLRRDFTIPPLPDYIYVDALSHSELNSCIRVVTETFCDHEPLTKAFLMKNTRGRVNRYYAGMKSLWQALLKDKLCFVAKTAESAGNEIVGFALGNIVTHYSSSAAPGDRTLPRYCPIPFLDLRCPISTLLGCGVCDFSQLPELKPLGKLYSEIFYRWAEWRDLDLTRGDIIQISVSGAARSTCGEHHAIPGASIVSICESEIIREAKRRSFRLIYTVCTNEVAKFIAREHGMRSRIVCNTRALLQELGVHVPEGTLGRVPIDHNIELFDYSCGEPERFDCLKSLPAAGLKIEILALNHDERVAAKVEKLVDASFRYFRRANISRELSFVSERKGNVVALLDAQNNDLIACAVFHTHTNEEVGCVGELLLLAVQSRHRGLGASKLLVSKIIDLGREQNWSSILLRANERVKHVYTAHGFRVIDAAERDRFALNIGRAASEKLCNGVNILLMDSLNNKE
ncbi:hypothetical protein ACA910_019830 [Epithemia clementina (nom. ined.)]